MDSDKAYREMTYIVNLLDELDHHIKRNDVYEMGRTMAKLNRACIELQTKFYLEIHPKADECMTQVYVVFRDSLEACESDEMIDIYMDRDKAQKFVDSQYCPEWYYVKEWKVKM